MRPAKRAAGAENQFNELILNEIQLSSSVTQCGLNLLLTESAQAFPCFCALLCFLWLGEPKKA